MATFYVSIGEYFWHPKPHPVASSTESDTIICTSAGGLFTCVVRERHPNGKVKKLELLDSFAYFDVAGNYTGSESKVG